MSEDSDVEFIDTEFIESELEDSEQVIKRNHRMISKPEADTSSLLIEKKSAKRKYKRRKRKTKQKQFKCDQCEFITHAKLYLNTHKVNTHNQEYFCQWCDYSTFKASNLKTHRSLKHRNVNYQRTLEHSEICKDGNYKCYYCAFESPFEGFLVRHLKYGHNEDLFIKSQCEHCGYSVRSQVRVMQHKEASKSENLFKCFCGFKTFYKCEYSSHRDEHFKFLNLQKVTQNTVENKNEIRCSKCSFETIYEDELQKHVLDDHGEVLERKFKCKLCSYSTNFKGKMNTHELTSKKTTVIKCIYCDFETFYSCESEKHSFLHCTEKCDYQRSVEITDLTNCKINLERNTTIVPKPLKKRKTAKRAIVKYKRPQKKSTTKKPVKKNTNKKKANETKVTKFKEMETAINLTAEEPIRSAEFSETQTVSNLTAELDEIREFKEKQSEDATKQSNECTDENYVDYLELSDLSDLESINSEPTLSIPPKKKTKRKEIPFQCTICDYTSIYRAYILKHFKRLHFGVQSKTFKCDHCLFSTDNMNRILLHNTKNKSKTLFDCEICPFTTYYKCASKLHLRKHYPINCNSCDEIFKDKFSLTKHFTMAHLINGYKCRHCNYTTDKKENLIAHKTVHFKPIEVPFKCNLCAYGSFKKVLLKAHMRQFHKIIPVKTMRRKKLKPQDNTSEKLARKDKKAKLDIEEKMEHKLPANLNALLDKIPTIIRKLKARRAGKE